MQILAFLKANDRAKIYKSDQKEKYDMAVQTTTGDRGVIISKYAKIKKIVGFLGKHKAINKLLSVKAKYYENFSHTVDLNLNALRALGFEPVSKKVSVFQMRAWSI